EEDFGEVILFADVPDPEIPKLFVNALFFILQREIPLGSRFSIAFGDLNHPIGRRYGKTALYFTRSFEDDEHFNEVHRGEAVGRVYQAFFITPAEDKFLDEQGADAFEEKFWKQFDDRLSDEERVDLLVDKSRAQQLTARLEELAQRSNKALSV